MNRSPSFRKNRPRQRGQVIVEYVLLLVIAVGFGYLLMSKLVSRNKDNPGTLTSTWHNLLVEIGQDLPDKHK